MINAILIEIEDANEDYMKACNHTAVASRNETDLLNKLNGLQKKFDEAVKTIKDSSPSGTDWKRGKHSGVEA